MAKSKFLKSLLTTASAVAVLAGGAQSASAAVRTTTGAGGAIVIVQNTGSAGALSAALAAGDSIQLNHARDITTGGAITIVAPGINANGNTGQTFNVGHAVTWPGATDLINVALNVTVGGAITIQDVTTKAVTISGGAVTIRHTLAADANGRVSVSGGTLAITNAGENVLVSGTGIVTQGGTVAGDVVVTGGGKYLGQAGADVTGAVTINTTAIGNTFNNADAVNVTQGSVTFNDAAGLVTVNGGTITAMNDAALGLNISSGTITNMNDITNGGLIASGGLISALNDIANGGNAALSGNAIVNQGGTIAGTLDVTGNAQYIGGAGANITGVVSFNTTTNGNTFNDANAAVNISGGGVTFNDANGRVTVTGGTITAMNDAVAGVTISGGTITNMNDITNGGLIASGGLITALNDIAAGGNAVLSGNAIVNQGGTIAGTLGVTGNAQYIGGAGANITGVVTINTTKAGNTFNNALAAANITQGSVTFNDAAGLVTVNGGTIVAMNDAALGLNISSGTITNMNDITNGGLVATGGLISALNDIANGGNAALSGTAIVHQGGTVAGTLGVAGNAQYLGTAGANITGAVTINTANAGTNTFNNSVAAVNVAQGKVQFNNAGGLLTVTGGEVVAMNDATNGVTISGGTITSIHDIAGAGLTATGGTITTLRNTGAFNSVLSGNALVNQTGTSGAQVQVTGNSQYLGTAGANITGNVIINTSNPGTNTFNNAVAAVNVAQGKVKFNNAGALLTVTGGEVVAMNDATNGVTISGGTITSIRDIAGADLTASGGVITALRNIGPVNAVLTGNAVVNQTGTIGGTLGVAGNSLYLGTTAANDITGAVTINTANAGMNTFHNSTADVTVTAGNLTMNNVGNDLIVNGASANAVITGNVVNDVTGGHATARATIAGNVGGIVDQAGIFEFTGTGTVTGAVGGGAQVTKIIVDTVDTRTFTNVGLNVAELNFAQNGTASLTAADLAATNVTTDTPGEGTVIVNANQAITGNIGAVNIKAVGIRTVAINTANFEANVLANAPDEVTVNTGVIASTRVGNLGSVGARLLAANFNITGGSVGDVYAKNTAVAAGVNQTFRGIVSGIDTTLATAASTASFADGSTVDTAIRSIIPGAGTVDFLGGTTIQKDIGAGGRAALVRFVDNDQFTANLNVDNIFADAITLRKGVINLNKNVTLNGATTITSTPLTLNDKKLTVAAGSNLVFSGNNEIDFVITATGDTVTGGQIQSNGPLQYTAGTTINITPDDTQSGRPTAGKTRVHTLIVNNNANPVVAGSTLDITKVTIDNSANVFTKWTPTIDAKGGLALTQEDNSKEVILGLLGTSADGVDKANIGALTSAPQGTDGAKLIDLLSLLKDSSNKLVKAKVDETLDRLPPVSTVADAIESTSGAVSMGLSQRMTNLAGGQGTPVQSRTVASSDAAMSGMNAGDDHARYGAWISPFFGKTTQKERKGAAGYKNDTYGASFGFDTRANDDMIIGGAVTVANNEMKHKNFKAGDKTKISSMMFSIYGMQQITDSWFAHGVATFGSNEVKNSEKRVSGLTTYDTVSGKYTSMSFNGEAMFGYNFLTEQVTFTPMAGLRYSRVNDGGYKETGSTTGQNIDVKTKASNKLEVVAGARIAGGTFDTNGMTVTPEVHGFINHDLIGKNPKQTLGLAGTNGLTVKSNKPVKTTFNVGAGVNFAYNMMEYGVGYDAEIATKRLGHQGTLKLRVNF